MSKKQKLIDKLKSRSRSFTYEEAVSLLLSLGFQMSNKGKTSGSRVAFDKDNMRIEIHRPHPHNELKRYQIAKLLSDLANGGVM